jgi:hypothetical protein
MRKSDSDRVPKRRGRTKFAAIAAEASDQIASLTAVSRTFGGGRSSSRT